MMDDNTILAALTKAANVVANEMKNRTSGGTHPSDLPSSIVVNPATKIGDGKYMCSISVKHPAGAAYEFGSGIHATRGQKGKYEIHPKNASVLVFPWQPEFVPWGSRKFSGAILESKDSTKGTYFFHFVEHPGVQARPYAIPSLRARKSELLRLLGSAIRMSVSIQDRYEEEVK